MPSLNEFASQYAEYIKRHSSSPTVVNDIANKIKELTYTKSKSFLTENDIDLIMDEIERILSSDKESSSGGFLAEAENSTKFIQMVKLIRKEAKKK